MRVAVEDFLFVDEGVGIGERGQKRRRGEFQAEYDCFRVRRLDRLDHRIIAAAHAEDAFRRVDDLVPARGHVGGGQGRAVREFDIVAYREGVGPAVISRLRNAGADIADEIGCEAGFSGLTRISTL